jgi:hypothetical protein
MTIETMFQSRGVHPPQREYPKNSTRMKLRIQIASLSPDGKMSARHHGLALLARHISR